MRFEKLSQEFLRSSDEIITGLPAFDRAVPLIAGTLTVLIGSSGIGKSCIASHIARVVSATHPRGVLLVRDPTNVDAVDATISFRSPALVVVDPLWALTAAARLPTWLADQPLDLQSSVDPTELDRVAQQLIGTAQRRHVPILVCHRHTATRHRDTARVIPTVDIAPLFRRASTVGVVRLTPNPRTLCLEVIRDGTACPTMLRLPIPLSSD